jgi:hypothetical protein
MLPRNLTIGRNRSPELSSEPVKLSDVQAGRIGEHLLAVYAMLTTDGALTAAETHVLRKTGHWREEFGWFCAKSV